jgi:hypothetical protein
VYAFRRYRAVENALQRGDFASLDPLAAVVLTTLGVALGVATVLLVVFAR